MVTSYLCASQVIILSSNKTKLSCLDPILIQFGMISIHVLAADQLAGAKNTVLEEPEPERHKASLIWIWIHFDGSPDWDCLNQDWTGSSDECYLESDYRLSAEVEYQFVCPICQMRLFDIIVRIAVGLWGNVEWLPNPNWARQMGAMHWFKGVCKKKREIFCTFVPLLNQK